MAVTCHEQEWEYRHSLQLVCRTWLREFEVQSAKTEKKKAARQKIRILVLNSINFVKGARGSVVG
jgi:hypothetical protein